ncbi:MAG: efflux RND transporter periplasmic adaptor subunit [Alphaproteobacteria bacterium]|nr:efflux RND transporter periplasmic adaptor subunit [Alphaproteobacteria bacterium]MDX5368017.1 efflux RND transporter periplasmic adaptor subunit [Alphaproteobacteria bacterium]MDX5462864.1 efflux RND transporter periplasmic adaptor subunit [Alphaproteobacteria bacterium]
MVKAAARLVLALLLLAGAAAGFLYMRNTAPEARPKPPEERVWTVTAIEAAFRDIQPELVAYGNVQAARTAELRPLVTAEVAWVSEALREGALVEAGEELVRLDPFTYEIALRDARARLAEAEAKLAELKAEEVGVEALLTAGEDQVRLLVRDLERRRDLARRGAGSDKSVDDAALRVNEARQFVAIQTRTLAQIKARIDQQAATVESREAAVASATRDLLNTTVRAPFRAWVSDVAIASGSRASTSDRIARLYATDAMEVRFELPNDAYGRLVEGTGGPVGQEVEIGWRVGARMLAFTGRIARIEASIDPAAGGVALFARFEGAADAAETPIRPGAFVAVRVRDRLYEDVLDLPARAVGEDGTVFVVGADSRLERVPVRIVGRDAGRVLLKAGIAPGTPILTTRFPELGPGVKVEVQG